MVPEGTHGRSRGDGRMPTRDSGPGSLRQRRQYPQRSLEQRRYKEAECDRLREASSWYPGCCSRQSLCLQMYANPTLNDVRSLTGLVDRTPRTWLQSTRVTIPRPHVNATKVTTFRRDMLHRPPVTYRVTESQFIVIGLRSLIRAWPVHQGCRETGTNDP